MPTMLPARRKAASRLRPSSLSMKRLQRLGACRQADQVVLGTDGDRGRDQVVAHAALAQMDLQAVDEEGDQLVRASNAAKRSP